MPAKERAVVERRAAWDGVVEIREGSFKRIRYAPHDDVFAPTVFLIPSGGSTGTEAFRDAFVRELERHSSVAMLVDLDANADDASKDLYSFYESYSGDSTNRTLTSINVLVARGTGVSLAVRLAARFTRNNVDAVVMIDPVFSPPSRRCECLARAVAPLWPSLAREALFNRTSAKLWPSPDVWRCLYQPTLVVTDTLRKAARVLSHLTDPTHAPIAFDANPVVAARRVVDHSAGVVAYYQSLRIRSSRGFALDADIDKEVTKESLDKYAGATLETGDAPLTRASA